ncbi:MAG: hypothetical protein ACPGNT_09560 [Rhodospirillales bacterium]
MPQGLNDMVFGIRFSTARAPDTLADWLAANTTGDWDLFHDSLNRMEGRSNLRALFSSKVDRDRFRDCIVVRDPGFASTGWERMQEFSMAGGLPRLPLSERRLTGERRLLRTTPGRRCWFAGSRIRPQLVGQFA